MVTKRDRELPDVLRNISTERGKRRLGMWDELIERRIDEARRDGVFDDLPGEGKPLDLKEPYCDPDNWMSLKILKNSGFVTDEIRYRREIEALREQLGSVAYKAEKRTLVRKINALIRKLNTMGTNIKPTDVAPLAEDEVVNGEDD